MCVCEARCKPELLNHELRHLLREFVMHAAQCEDASAGGVLVLVRRDVGAVSVSQALRSLLSGGQGVATTMGGWR